METSAQNGQVQFTLSKEQIFMIGVALGAVLALAYLWLIG